MVWFIAGWEKLDLPIGWAGATRKYRLADKAEEGMCRRIW
jgi:hypothetical protein